MVPLSKDTISPYRVNPEHTGTTLILRRSTVMDFGESCRRWPFLDENPKIDNADRGPLVLYGKFTSCMFFSVC